MRNSTICECARPITHQWRQPRVYTGYCSPGPVRPATAVGAGTRGPSAHFHSPARGLTSLPIRCSQATEVRGRGRLRPGVEVGWPVVRPSRRVRRSGRGRGGPPEAPPRGRGLRGHATRQPDDGPPHTPAPTRASGRRASARSALRCWILPLRGPFQQLQADQAFAGRPDARSGLSRVGRGLVQLLASALGAPSGFPFADLVGRKSPNSAAHQTGHHRKKGSPWS